MRTSDGWKKCNRTAEVRGSIPLGSTNKIRNLRKTPEIAKSLGTHRAHTKQVVCADAMWRAATPLR